MEGVTGFRSGVCFRVLTPVRQSYLRLNVHPHTLALDAVYVRDESSAQLVFHQLPEPTHQEVEQLASRIAQRSEKVMRKHGRWVDDDSAEMQPEQLSLDYRALSQCYGASVRETELLSERAGQPYMRLLSLSQNQTR